MAPQTHPRLNTPAPRSEHAELGPVRGGDEAPEDGVDHRELGGEAEHDQPRAQALGHPPLPGGGAHQVRHDVAHGRPHPEEAVGDEERVEDGAHPPGHAGLPDPRARRVHDGEHAHEEGQPGVGQEQLEVVAHPHPVEVIHLRQVRGFAGVHQVHVRRHPAQVAQHQADEAHDVGPRQPVGQERIDTDTMRSAADVHYSR